MKKHSSLVGIFGANLRKYRNLRGLSQRALNAISGVDHGMISRMENGQINVSLNTIYVLADALGVQGADLLENTDDETTSIDTNTVALGSNQEFEKYL